MPALPFFILLLVGRVLFLLGLLGGWLSVLILILALTIWVWSGHDGEFLSIWLMYLNFDF
jgi:hypothetical protein